MSYYIQLLDPITKKRVACLHITYYYFHHFRKVLGERGIRTLYGMTSVQAIPLLKKAISELKDDIDSDYWKPTEGNAKQALRELLALAESRPDGILNGD